ncbi:thioesterase II family protein [Streptomyces tsukubensis]
MTREFPSDEPSKIRKRRPSPGGSWLRHFSVPPASGREILLVVLPHAGGSAGYYRALADSLSQSAEVACVQYPGRQDRFREPPVLDLMTLAHRIAEALGGEGNRPLAVFGHSMGATVGFELSRILESNGNPPVALFASGRRAPGRVRHEVVHQLDDTALLTELRALGGTNGAVLANDEMLRLFLPAIRGDYQAIETYRCTPGASVSCPVTALVGDCDPRVSPDEARDWGRHTSGRFSLRLFRGGHFYLDDHLSSVADLVRSTLVPDGSSDPAPRPQTGQSRS